VASFLPGASITVWLIPKAVRALRRLKRRTGLSATDIINRAIQLYRWMDETEDTCDICTINRQTGEMSLVTFE
jgi:hypothetical protein